MGGGKKRREKVERAKKHVEYLREKKQKRKEAKAKFQACMHEISKEEYESYDGLCWECWDDQMTEECEFEEGII
jgi:hypothetical protein